MEITILLQSNFDVVQIPLLKHRERYNFSIDFRYILKFNHTSLHRDCNKINFYFKQSEYAI